jgi:hypothetical protein
MYHATFLKMNIPVEKEEILGSPVCQLKASPEFIKHAQKMGFETLGDITSVGWGELQRHEKFTYSWFNELVRILEEHHILHLLEKQ